MKCPSCGASGSKNFSADSEGLNRCAECGARGRVVQSWVKGLAIAFLGGGLTTLAGSLADLLDPFAGITAHIPSGVVGGLLCGHFARKRFVLQSGVGDSEGEGGA